MKFSKYIFFLFSVVALISCNKDFSYDVESISIDVESLDLVVDQRIILHAEVSPEWALDHTYNWSSSDNSVVRVYQDGLAVAISPGKAVVTVTSKDGAKTATCEVNVSPFEMEFVDLGLSVKWAKCNLGATKETEFGDYLAWGELTPYYEPGQGEYSIPAPQWKSGKEAGYSQNCYKFSDDEVMTKYTKSGEILELEDDAAHAKYGGHVRMPTYKEWKELYSNCKMEYMTYDGIKGISFCSDINKERIFIPEAGFREGTRYQNYPYILNYWSSTLANASYLSGLSIQIKDYQWETFFTYNKRWYGMPIRPVSD